MHVRQEEISKYVLIPNNFHCFHRRITTLFILFSLLTIPHLLYCGEGRKEAVAQVVMPVLRKAKEDIAGHEESAGELCHGCRDAHELKDTEHIALRRGIVDERI